MNPRVIRIVALLSTAAAIALGVSVSGHASSSTAPTKHNTVATITDRLARQLASPLAGDARRAGVLDSTKPVDLAAVHPSAAFDSAVARADHDVSAAKGLPTTAGLVQVRLADPSMRAALRRGVAPLFAAAPNDDRDSAVTAYARDGSTVKLDPNKVPDRPVFVVEVDTAKALPAGLEVMRGVLDRHGISKADVKAADGGYWATQVTSVRLNDDKEPWVKGGAEIFGIAGGFGLDGKVKVDTVQMPYLDNDGTTYYPNQLIVHFSAYKYNLADFVMMEDDGDTNYQSLAVAIANALLTIVDGGAYTPIVDAILNALPASWWTDDPDYVDSWYTLSTTSSGQLTGAAANGTMTVAPYWVAPI